MTDIQLKLTSSVSEIYDTELCQFYIKDQRILVITGKSEIITMNKLDEAFKEVKKVIGDKKLPLCFDASFTMPFNKNIRLRLEEILADIGLGLAAFSSSSVGNMIINIFFSLSNNELPRKAFKKKEEAIEWLTNQNLNLA
ncbi:MAG: hypothetical protein ACI9XP_000376 [Lentimonas sp.]|jgi:hypothetical protein